MKLLLRIVLAVMPAGAALAQTAPAPLAFEVATVKPSPPLDMAAMRAGTAHIGTKIDAARVDIGMASLFRLICTAYRVRAYQVVGPDWLKSSNFDIQATIPAGAGTDKIPEMLRTLLIERFGLKVRRDTKDQPVYALVVAAGGMKMKESGPEPPAPPSPPGEPKPMEMSLPTVQGDVKLIRTAQGAAIEMPGGEISGRLRMTPGGGPALQFLHFEGSGTSMKAFADMLSVGLVDRPVVDMTGLKGNYEVAVDVSQDEAMKVARSAITFLPMGTGHGGGDADGGAVGASDPSGSSIFKSIQNLGLKLEPRKLPLELLVVEYAEKTPSAN